MMTEEHKSIIISQKPKLVSSLTPRHFQAELEAEKIINDSESDAIFGRNLSERDQCQTLLTILTKGTDAAYYRFGKLLCDKGKPHLANLLIMPKVRTDETPSSRKGVY